MSVVKALPLSWIAVKAGQRYAVVQFICPMAGFRRTLMTSNHAPNSNDKQKQENVLIQHAIKTVRQHDPAGYLPGQLLPNSYMSAAYYAVRSFWIETGLRFGSTAQVANPIHAAPAHHLEWWQEGINAVFDSASTTMIRNGHVELNAGHLHHPTLQLLLMLLEKPETAWTKKHFDDILQGRRVDLDVRQYDTLADLVRHAEQSCGSLAQLVLESDRIDSTSHPVSHQSARLVGVCHGLTNALRLSIPVMSTTGKLIIPAELTTRHGVKSPRYLLSGLAQGDQTCAQALQHAVQDIVLEARRHLREARELRAAILAEELGRKAVSVMLPGLASESFLTRLEGKQYQLTDRNLRHVSFLEQAVCSARMVTAYYSESY